MSDEETTYTTVRFHKSSSGLQNRGRPEETQVPRKAGRRECSVPWKPIAIHLGIFCSILLVAIAVLVTLIFQYRQKKHDQEKTIKILNQKYHILKNESYLKEQIFNNTSTECDALKDHLNSVNREWKTCYGEIKIVLDCIQHTGKRVEGHWYCCGIKCYYFLMDNKLWNGCKQTCEGCSLSLLKIDDDDELTFLKSQLHPKSYWIGSSYDRKKRKWKWIVDGPSKLNLTGLKSVHDTGDCASLSSNGMHDEDCGKSRGCICEKRVEKFPCTVCSARFRLAMKAE